MATDRAVRVRHVILLPGLLAACLLIPGRAAAQVPVFLQLHLIAGNGAAAVITVPLGDTAPIIDTTSTAVGTNVSGEIVHTLPLGTRDLSQILTLAPMASGERKTSIAGSFTSDNLYLLDGVPLQHPAAGRFAGLFTPEFVEQIRIQTSALPAEYGRSTGGIVNVVTKSGANEFSGSVFGLFGGGGSTEFEDARDLEPRRATQNFEAALGGPIVRDKFWFFAGTDAEHRARRGDLFLTETPFDRHTTDFAVGAKFFYRAHTNHSVTGYFGLDNGSRSEPSDERGVNARTLIEPTSSLRAWTAKYTGNLSADLSFSAFGAGVNTSEDNVGSTGGLADSPQINLSGLWLANYPLGNGNVSPETSSVNAGASLNWANPGFLRGLGDHTLKIGFERYTQRFEGSGAPSGTDHILFVNHLLDNGRPIINDNDWATPLFRQFETQLLQFDSQATHTWTGATTSFHVQDTFSKNNWTLSAGLRYDGYDAGTDGTSFGGGSTWSPRVGFAYNLEKDNRWTFHTSYGQYAGRFTPELHGAFNLRAEKATAYVYAGPNGMGNNFMPGFDLNNYLPFFVDDPAVTNQVDPDIKPFTVNEWAVGADHKWSAGGLKVGYLMRWGTNFPEDFTGERVTVERDNLSSDFDATVFGNTSELERSYSATWIDVRHRFSARLSTGLAYTYTHKLDGNYDGERAPEGTAFGDYPEAFVEDRHFPVGRLQLYHPHQLSTWAHYNLWNSGENSLNLGVRVQATSGTSFPFTVSRSLTTTQINRLLEAGYADPPSAQTIYFGNRAGGHHNSDKRVNFSLDFDRRSFLGLGNLKLRVEVSNALNGGALRRFNSTVVAQGPIDSIGLPTDFELGNQHGEPTSRNDAQPPRAIAVTVRYVF